MTERLQYLNSQLAMIRDLTVIDAYVDTESWIDRHLGVPTLLFSDQDVKRCTYLQLLRDDDAGGGGSFWMADEKLPGHLSPRRLPMVTLGGRTFFIDNRLQELRNVNAPYDVIRFGRRRP